MTDITDVSLKRNPLHDDNQFVGATRRWRRLCTAQLEYHRNEVNRYIKIIRKCDHIIETYSLKQQDGKLK